MSRYNRVKRFSKNRISRIGTADIPKVEDQNSDILLIATDGDRCDIISQEYYGTPDLWWFIASVNNLNSNNENQYYQYNYWFNNDIHDSWTKAEKNIT